MRTKIIAEVGECFNGNLDTAYQMIEEAKKAGCDIVKFQLLDMDEVAMDDPEYDWFAKLNLPPEKIASLIRKAEECGIGILFTPVSVKTAQFIYEAGQKSVKIASSFINKTELLQYINEHFETVYVSTGMAQLEEIAAVIELLNRPQEIIILHCVSEYPTGPLLEERGLCALDEKDVHMNMMGILKMLYPHFQIGYSDHTDTILAPVVAAAMGADVIEKHFTLDRTTPIAHFNRKEEYMGTDHVLSIEPPLLREMVAQIRRTETIRGAWKWERSDGEKILKDFLRGRYTERE
ncbi:N-acetylneuraminate synthase family protein [Lachnospiraceae bacterium JLR.KK008]